MSLVSKLKEFSLFEGFSDAELRQIATFIEEVEFQDGQTILHESGGTKSLYFLLSGKVRVLREISGKNSIITKLSAFDVFGEVAFADQGQRSATIMSDGVAQIGVFEYDHFEIIKKQNPALGMKFLLQMMRSLASKFRVVNKSLDNLLKNVLGETN
ncbi:MAG: cyclic nucleotide-binding domain-containing protein [Candidatus Ozemobacteraceae bacterium]